MKYVLRSVAPSPLGDKSDNRKKYVRVGGSMNELKVVH
jgi:hypothetical protein